MIVRVPFTLQLSKVQLQYLISLRPWNGKWSLKDPPLAEIKTEIKRQLRLVQNSCAYCGIRFKGEADAQIEHISPKAPFRTPNFTFTLRNLVLGCVYCNQLVIKGTTRTVNEPHARYNRCTFLIVHPYFDNPDDHYHWTEEVDKILIQANNNSAKGIFSIGLFTLDSSAMSEMRAAQVTMDRIKASKALSAEDENLVVQALA